MSLFLQHEQSDPGLDSALTDCRIRLAAAALAGCLITASAPVHAQQVLPPLQQQLHQDPQAPAAVPYVDPPGSGAPAAEEQPPASGHRPGFLDALGRWLGDSKAVIDSQMKSTQERLGTLGRDAKDAADSVIAVPGSRVVTGRQLCPAAANGAPDCQQGVEILCRANGFQGGRSLDIASSQRCPAKVWMSGRPPAEGECRLDTYVTRAVCQ